MSRGGMGVVLIVLNLMFVCLLNIPFGYWRENVKKLSVQWFMAVHFPVPFVALLRNHLELSGALTLLLFVAAYFMGQYLGSRLSREFRHYGKVSSSLAHDLIRRSWIIIIGR
ncbi:hypothetical protein [Desulfitobacterium sp. PCE1]|uniref:Uncharacterized protein n=2 Tax=Desulfitobacterium dehalogenans TaxID=36854 RepID=I4AAD7_DESDJ|nr:hypothetical protein [Desulfitobacterium sp. PCE1]AFM00922.1 hypothetical protein Desde_2592 [Desulfitobacterium dehalogenans ATCC 51507]